VDLFAPITEFASALKIVFTPIAHVGRNLALISSIMAKLTISARTSSHLKHKFAKLLLRIL